MNTNNIEKEKLLEYEYKQKSKDKPILKDLSSMQPSYNLFPYFKITLANYCPIEHVLKE